MIKYVKDEDATLLSNGEPLEITASQYWHAPRLSQWCLVCHTVTEHLMLRDPLKDCMAKVCNGDNHPQGR